MYNKLFAKILDSSIWLEPDSTRIVWMTCLAAMDEDGFCSFASPANLAHRAVVPLDACVSALATLEGVDPNSSDPDNDGRRLERVPGGWLVRNASKYRDLVSREIAKAANRRRVARHRETKRAGNAGVMPGNAPSRKANASVTLSDTEAEADTETRSDTETDKNKDRRAARSSASVDALFEQFWSAYPKKRGKDDALRAWKKRKPSSELLGVMLVALEAQKRSDDWLRDGGKFIPHPATWLNGGRWHDEAPTHQAQLGMSDLMRYNLANAEEAVRMITANTRGGR